MSSSTPPSSPSNNNKKGKKRPIDENNETDNNDSNNINISNETPIAPRLQQPHHNAFLHSLSSAEASRRWSLLTQRRQQVTQNIGNSLSNSKSEKDEEEDPFDCSAIALPTTYTRADRILDEFTERWKQLDERLIDTMNGFEGDGDNDDEEEYDRREFLSRRLHQARRQIDLKIPQHFDYATRRSEPPPDSDEDKLRVVSLSDPTKTHSYEHHLWKLFQQVPTVEELDKQALEGAQLPRVSATYNEIVEGTLDYPRLDGHALSRFRMNDRHGMPPTQSIKEPTVVLEFWRRNLKRGTVIDDNRAVMEFKGSQTLLDVHGAIVELTQDELWSYSGKEEGSDVDHSGFFFIEGTFYKTGSVDYVTPIQEWLKTDIQDEGTKSRAKFLGIAGSPPLPVLSMEDTKLADIPFRLGIRYLHSHHGDVEVSVLMVDRKHYYIDDGNVAESENHQSIQFPILHDIWGPSVRIPECEACKRLSAAKVTSSICPLTLGSRILCIKCSHLLFGNQDTATQKKDQGISTTETNINNNKKKHDSDTKATMLQPFTVWRYQPELSIGAQGD